MSSVKRVWYELQTAYKHKPAQKCKESVIQKQITDDKATATHVHFQGLDFFNGFLVIVLKLLQFGEPRRRHLALVFQLGRNLIQLHAHKQFT